MIAALVSRDFSHKSIFLILLSPNFLNGCVGSKATQLDSEQNSYLMSWINFKEQFIKKWKLCNLLALKRSARVSEMNWCEYFRFCEV